MSDDKNDQGDYSEWGWKAVVKHVTGHDPDHPENDGNAKFIADPQSIQDAADTFWYAEQVIQRAAESISDQAQALTGENGPWKGSAAKALNRVMGTLSKQVKDLGNTLSGGITGDYNIPQQLANNAAHLREAGQKITDIDSFYAKQALAQDPSLMMDNGSVHIGAKPKLVAMMTSDMQKVVSTLGSHYKVTEDNVAQPKSPTTMAGAPPNTGSGVPNPYNNIGGYSPNGPNFGGVNLAGYNSPNIPDYSPTGAPHTGNGNLPDFHQSNSPEAMPNSDTGAGPGAGNVPDYAKSPDLSTNAPDTGSPTPYPNAGDLGGTDAPNGTALSGGSATPNMANIPLQVLGKGLSSQNGARDANPSAYPDTGLDTPGTNMPNSGALDPSMDAALNPATSNIPNMRYPDLGLGGPTNKNAGTPNLKANVAPKPYTGGLGLDDTGKLGGGSGAGPNAGTTPYSGANIPKLDTSGIKAPTSSPLSSYPDTSLSSANPSGLGSSAGGGGLSSYPNTGLSDPSAGTSLASAGPEGTTMSPGTGGGANMLSQGGGSGMPMMPMGGMGGGMGAGGGGAEGAPSDASGLLQGDATPWRGSSLLDDTGHLNGGAVRGGEGLDFSPRGLDGDGLSLDGSGTGLPSDGLSSGTGDGLPSDGLSLDSSGGSSDSYGDGLSSGASGGANTASQGGGSGMPMMPMGGMGGGMGAGGSGSEGAPSDASGLLQGDATPWRGAGLDSTPEATGGAGTGGAGLDFSPRGLPSDGLPADAPSEQEAAAPETGTPATTNAETGTPATTNADAFAMGTLDGLPFLASTWGTGTVGQYGSPAAANTWSAPGSSGTQAPRTGTPNGTHATAATAGTAGTEPAVAPPVSTAVTQAAPDVAPAPHATPDVATPDVAAPETAPEAAGEPVSAPQHAEAPAEAPAAQSLPTHALTSREAPAAVHQPEPAPVMAPPQQAPAVAVAGQAPAPAPQAPAPAPQAPAPQQAVHSTPAPASAPATGTAPASAPAASVTVPTSGPLSAQASAPAAAPSSMPAAAPAPASASAPAPAAAPATAPAPAPASAHAASAPASVPAKARATTPAADPASASAPQGASVADDAEAWDADLLPLFGAKGGHAGGVTGAEEAVGAAGVVGASAYMVARGAGSEQAFAEPARPAWRPKPSSEGGMLRELSCSGIEPEEKPKTAATSSAESEKDGSSAGQARGRGKGKEGDADGRSSVADLLRQSDDIWGGGGFK
ncbi:hypothetical protein [Streptomyces sp. NPDC054765]